MYPETGYRQSGLGLPSAIFVIVILSMMAIAITELDANSSEAVVFDVQSTKAFLAAQSGVQLGLNRLYPPGQAASNCSNPYFSATPSISFGTTGLDDCTATVSCAEDIVGGVSYYTLNSLGQCGTGPGLAQRAVEVRVR